MILPFLRGMGPMSNKPPSTPGSANYGVGSRGVLIPVYTTLTVQIWGSSGGGGGANNTLAGAGGANAYFGGTGGASWFSFPGGTLIAYGGGGGGNGLYDPEFGPTNGAGGGIGGASGGSTNAAGSGNSGGGGAILISASGGPGGRGGFVSRTWNWYDAGAPAFGSTLTLTCGGGGGGGAGFFNDGELGTVPCNGNAGADASASVSWT